MKPQFALYFLIIGTIQLGLLLGIFHYQKTHLPLIKSRLWTLSLAVNVLALYTYGIGIFYIEDVSRPPFSFTIANTLFYAASLLQMLFCISLNAPLRKSANQLVALSIIVFLTLFEYLRNNSDFESRTILSATTAFLFYCIQIYALRIHKKTSSSLQINYLIYVSALELFLALSRTAIVSLPDASNNQIHQIQQVPVLLTFVTLFQLVMNTISYIAIGGYWTEKIAIANHQFDLENERIKQLLAEKNKLIYSLSVANRTAATGALAASIAHELNQPLGSSNLNIQLLRRKLESGDVDMHLSHEILEALQNDNSRASTIIQSLRSIFLEEEITYQQVSLKNLIDEVLNIIHPELNSRNIVFKLDLDSQIQIKCIAIQIKQVLLNIFNNAIYSLTSSKRKSKIIQLSATLDSSFIVIDIYDNGDGISNERSKELFELLSGSKKSGMGLGLWLSKHIISHHAGSIENVSTVEGALFRIKLPLPSVSAEIVWSNESDQGQG